MIYAGREGGERKGGWKDARTEGRKGRGVDSIISNFMAAFNGNTITFQPSGVRGRRESEMAVNALFYRSIEGGEERKTASQPASPNRLHLRSKIRKPEHCALNSS